MGDRDHPSAFYIPESPKGLPGIGRSVLYKKEFYFGSCQYNIRIILIFLSLLKNNSSQRALPYYTNTLRISESTFYPTAPPHFRKSIEFWNVPRLLPFLLLIRATCS
jgi:hypothetical protein